MHNDEEKKFLEELSNGSRIAFESLYHLYRTQVYRLIYKLVRSHEVSQEILQDVFVKIWNQRTQLERIQSFRSYLYSIAQNLVYDYFRKVAADRAKIETFKTQYAVYSIEDVEQAINFKEVKAHLDEVLALIPEKCRQVYILCKLEGRSYQEVSKLLNISVATVNNHIVKATGIIKSNWRSDVFWLFLFFFIFQ